MSHSKNSKIEGSNFGWKSLGHFPAQVFVVEYLQPWSFRRDCQVGGTFGTEEGHGDLETAQDFGGGCVEGDQSYHATGCRGGVGAENLRHFRC